MLKIELKALIASQAHDYVNVREKEILLILTTFWQVVEFIFKVDSDFRSPLELERN